MQFRPLLLGALCASLLLAGCAQEVPPDNGIPASLAGDLETMALFAAAAKNMPSHFGTEVIIERAQTTLLHAEGVYGAPAKTAYMQITLDRSVVDAVGASTMSDLDASILVNTSVYMGPAGTVLASGDRVMLRAPDEAVFGQAMESSQGMGAILDPAAFLRGLPSSGFSVISVEPTTLRGQAAQKVTASIPQDGQTAQVTYWIFSEPARLARAQMPVPSQGQASFAGARMTMDMLYGEEIRLTAPPDLARVLGLRYTSDKNAIMGEQNGTETWTFQVDSDILLSEVTAEVGRSKDARAWTMLLSDRSRSKDGIALLFTDVDGDDEVSAGDTLAIHAGEGEVPKISLLDAGTGLRVVSGVGPLLAVLAAGVLGPFWRRR